MTVFSANTNVIKMAYTSKDELLQGGGIRHLTATSQYQAHSNQVPLA